MIHASPHRADGVRPACVHVRHVGRGDGPIFDLRRAVRVAGALRRVGSQPFLRAVSPCLAGTERPPMVRVELSERVVSTDGQGVGVRNEGGALACTLAVEAASEYPGVECPSLDPAGDLVLPALPARARGFAGCRHRRALTLR